VQFLYRRCKQKPKIKKEYEIEENQGGNLYDEREKKK
jgi:hypothetical protein